MGFPAILLPYRRVIPSLLHVPFIIMVLILMIYHNIYFFVTKQFEWAWQNPGKSRRLCHISNKKTKEKDVEFRFRVLSEMLNVGPWNRLPLMIRWLKQEYKMEFEKQPPTHMPIAYGPLSKRKPEKSKRQGREELEDINISHYTCVVCSEEIKVCMYVLHGNYCFTSIYSNSVSFAMKIFDSLVNKSIISEFGI